MMDEARLMNDIYEELLRLRYTMQDIRQLFALSIIDSHVGTNNDDIVNYIRQNYRGDWAEMSKYDAHEPDAKDFDGKEEGD